MQDDLLSVGVAPVFSQLQEDFPDFCLAAATDDLIAIIKPELDTDDGWQRSILDPFPQQV